MIILKYCVWWVGITEIQRVWYRENQCKLSEEIYGLFYKEACGEQREDTQFDVFGTLW